MDEPKPAEPTPSCAPGGDIGKRARQAKFIAAFACVGNVTYASRMAGVSRKTHYTWLRDDPDVYGALIADAREDAIDTLTAEARRRAVQGVRTPLLYKGAQVKLPDPEGGEDVPQWITRYSDGLLMFLLKAARPDKYGDGPRAEPVPLSPTRPASPPFDMSRLTPAEQAELLAITAKASAAPPPAEPSTPTD